jgi:outer membrane protein TolC
LTQAERNLIYSMYDFETYKRTFAVQVATNYLGVLQQSNQVDNAAENYRNLIESTRRVRMLADAGRVTEIDVDQAVQKELAARIRWIGAMEAHKSQTDSFKNLIGLPPDASIELDDSVLKNPSRGISTILSDIKEESPQDSSQELVPPGQENAGPMEMDEKTAINLGLDNRLDLRVLEGKVYDAQRGVIVAADALGAELTLLGKANLGQSRSLATANLKDSSLDINEGIYTGLLTLDLPLERTAERNAYRESYITLERAVREFQKLEDDIKLSVRNRLRDMLEAREGLITQTKAVELAEKRVKSVNLFLEAGRAQIRDLLDAQDSLLTARNALTAALVNYRSAELEFQRDAGILKIDKNGFINEYNSKGKDNG